MAGKIPHFVYTTGDPNATTVPAGVAVAIKLDGGDAATDAQIQQFVATHPNNPIIGWQQEADQRAVDFVNRFHPAAFVAGGESADQMNSAASIGSQIGVPKMIVTNGNYVPTWPPGWGASFEFYKNDPNYAYLSPQNLRDFITTVMSEGASFASVTLGSWGSRTVSYDAYQQALDFLRQNGINVDNISIFTWEQMTDDERRKFLALLDQNPTATDTTSPTTPEPAGAPAAPPGGNSREGQGPDRNPSPTATNRGPSRPPDVRDAGDASAARDRAAGPSVVAAPEYRGGKGIVKTSVDPDTGIRTDITSTGAVIQTRPGGTPKRTGWVDPASGYGMSTFDGSGGNETNPYTRQSEPATFAENNVSAWRNIESGNSPTSSTSSEAQPAATFAENNVSAWRNIESGNPPPPSSGLVESRPAATFQENNVSAWRNIESGNPPPPPSTPAGGFIPPNPNLSSALTDTGASQLIKEAAKGFSQPGSPSRITSGGGGFSSGGSPSISPAAQEIFNPPQVSPDAVPVSGGGCFIAGSKVLTPDGEKAIEEVKLGDMVQTWDMDKKQVVQTQVTDTLAHHDRTTLVIQTDKGSLTTTAEHPFWTGSEWLPAGKLVAGESSVFDNSGNPQKVTKIENGPKANVYNFHVTAPAHNYFVEGFLVHNMKMGI